MSVDAIAALVFVFFLGVFLWKKRGQVKFQRALFPLLYVVMYRSSFGLKTMNRLAGKFPRTLSVLGSIGVVVGFLGMLLICVELVLNTANMVLKPGVAPGIQPVLPVEAKGVFFVPFLYWIISIFLLALVHEFAHGVMSRVHKVRVKSSGFAFLCVLLPVIPAAFVEPDERVLKRKSFWKQWSVFAAGPVSNFLFALLIVGVIALFSPALAAAFDTAGVEVAALSENSPAAGLLEEGDIIVGVNGASVASVKNLTDALSATIPGEMAEVETTKGTVSVALAANPKNESQGFLGIQGRTHSEPNAGFEEKYGAWLPPALQWFAGLLFWLFMLNVGIGLFNLLPIGPLDGGRMFHLACLRLFRKKATAMRVWGWTSFFFVAIILVNILVGVVR